MTYYIKNGNTFKVTDENSVDIRTSLPVGNYIVKYNEMANQYFLEETELFTLPEKRYADNDAIATRILNTYLNRNKSTGVLLTGEKGSGKSLLSKTVSVFAYESGISTLIINSHFFGDSFNKFIQDISQPCIIFFDEFEKTYDKDLQEKLLTLFDGAFSANKLFMLTSNSTYKIETNMINRPGRIHYMLEFGSVSIDFIREYCEENLTNQAFIDKIVKLSSMFNPFSFDMLKAIVEESNMYDEDPLISLDFLNLKAESNRFKPYAVTLTTSDGVTYPYTNGPINCNPFSDGTVYTWGAFEKDTIEADEYYFTLNDIIKLDDTSVTYKNKEGVVLVLTESIKETNDGIVKRLLV